MSREPLVGWIGSAIIAIDEIIETTGAPSFHAFLKTAPCKEVLVDAESEFQRIFLASQTLSIAEIRQVGV